MQVILPFPNGKLSPNRAKGMHWGATSSLKGRQFDDAYLRTKQAMNDSSLTGYHMTIKFCEPDKRCRDLDNLLAASKSAIDGIASALGVNDKDFNPITIERGYVTKNGLMIVSFE